MKISAGCIYTYRQVDRKFYMEVKELELLETILRKKNEVGRLCLLDFLNWRRGRLSNKWRWSGWTSVEQREDPCPKLTSHTKIYSK